MEFILLHNKHFINLIFILNFIKFFFHLNHVYFLLVIKYNKVLNIPICDEIKL
jgi:hypothetical protein